MGRQATGSGWVSRLSGLGNLVVTLTGVLLAALGSWHVLESGAGGAPVEAAWTVFINVLLVALSLLGTWASYESLLAGDLLAARPTRS